MTNKTTKIVVLDGATATQVGFESQPADGEPTWDELDALGQLTLYARTPVEQVVERAGDAACVLTNKTLLPVEVIKQLPSLRYVGVLATGVNVVDIEAAGAQGITVTNIPGYSTPSVAQHVFALIMSLTNHVDLHSQAARGGQWADCPDFSFTLRPLVELQGKQLGIVGLGAIGRQVARIGSALGMKIAAAHQRSMHDVKLHGIDVNWMPHDELFVTSDVVTLHCPLTPDTKGMVDASRIASMKKDAYLINTGRGPLVDEPALAQALDGGHLAGVGLDVLSSEPPAHDNPLLAAPRSVITPHVAWATQAARARLMQIAAANVRAFLDGSPTNVVS